MDQENQENQTMLGFEAFKGQLAQDPEFRKAAFGSIDLVGAVGAEEDGPVRNQRLRNMVRVAERAGFTVTVAEVDSLFGIDVRVNKEEAADTLSVESAE